MYNIQNANEADIPLIRELCMRVWPQTYQDLLAPEQIDYMLEMMYSNASLQKQISEGIQFILAYEDKEPVGFASYELVKPTVYKLHKLYVLPSQQGKGTGRFMIDHIISQIKPAGATALQLQVNRNNKARYFYEKLGFTIVEEFKLDIGNGFVMDDFLMEKSL